MDADDIVEIGIDAEGSLYVMPKTARFPLIYRSAMEVSWDPLALRLYGPKPRQWSYLDWFKQIRSAAAGEYGISLQITSQTRWTDIPDDLRKQMEAA